ncbi:alpha/beta fold hydrolase [Nocardioides sp.]|uniref:alpha/beta fold hydrolase n=1 Tax=Nocardioides sp. TaxID=35761 RepID=UPI002735CBE1|nr:alpha/beta fold hydrolase [Nocardioides sp.]MDP3892051.1 alpha/beta fold hydrolase [Nocardioides sp.]
MNPTWLDRELFPYTHKRLELDGHDLAYVDEGEGPPLLMLHGNPTWSFLYRDVIAALRGHFRCIAPDLPGFGLSTAADGFGFRPAEHADVIERFIGELGLQDITLMVHDWGGPIGLGVAGRRPELFSALVLTNTSAWPANGDLRIELVSRLIGGPIGRLAITDGNAFVNLMIPAGIRRGGPSSAVMAAYRGPFAKRGDRYPTYVFPREILKSRAFLAEVEAGLPLLRDLPALIVWGDRDFAFGDKERTRFEELFPEHRTVVLEGAGHFIAEDAAPEIVEAVKDWAADRTPRAREAP